jgi:hypothetical protein
MVIDPSLTKNSLGALQFMSNSSSLQSIDGALMADFSDQPIGRHLHSPRSGQ